jgi:hypothetical protein
MTRQALESEADIQGWYYRTATSEAVRIRLSTVAGSILLHTLSGRLVASWAPGHLEMRATDVIGERWTIGDRRLPEAFLVLESDKDHAAIRKVSVGLWPTPGTAMAASGLRRGRVWQPQGLAGVAPRDNRCDSGPAILCLTPHCSTSGWNFISRLPHFSSFNT